VFVRSIYVWFMNWTKKLSQWVLNVQIRYVWNVYGATNAFIWFVKLTFATFSFDIMNVDMRFIELVYGCQYLELRFFENFDITNVNIHFFELVYGFRHPELSFVTINKLHATIVELFSLGTTFMSPDLIFSNVPMSKLGVTLCVLPR